MFRCVFACLCVTASVIYAQDAQQQGFIFPALTSSNTDQQNQGFTFASQPQQNFGMQATGGQTDPMNTMSTQQQPGAQNQFQFSTVQGGVQDATQAGIPQQGIITSQGQTFVNGGQSAMPTLNNLSPFPQNGGNQTPFNPQMNGAFAFGPQNQNPNSFGPVPFPVQPQPGQPQIPNGQSSMLPTFGSQFPGQPTIGNQIPGAQTPPGTQMVGQNPFAPAVGNQIPGQNPFAPAVGNQIPGQNPFAPAPGTQIPGQNPFAPAPGSQIPGQNPFAPAPGTQIPGQNPFAPAIGNQIPGQNPFAPGAGNQIGPMPGQNPFGQTTGTQFPGQNPFGPPSGNQIPGQLGPNGQMGFNPNFPLQQCHTSGCPTGYQCVFSGPGDHMCPNWIPILPCGCRPGCQNQNQFIPFQMSRQVDVCGNTCSCTSRDGQAACTMRACPAQQGK